MITTHSLGFITLPFRLNLFVMSGLTRTPISAIVRKAVPIVGAMIVVSAIIRFVPALSMWGVTALKF